MLTDQGNNIRIIKLPETEEIKPGYYVPVDSVVDGTKKFDLSGLTTAIEGKADASEIEGLQEEIASKAGPEEIEALEIEIEGKASQDDLVTLSGTVDQLEDDVSTAQDDITALQTAVEDLQIIPDTSAASAGDFLSFDGTGLEWTELPDMKVQAGTDIKVEGNVVSVNTNGTVANSADMSFVAGSGTYARGIGSVAFGINTSAIGNRGAFAEGEKTYAEYDCHAEGWGTSALATNSHAEGQSTLANANCSHTEGYGTSALNTNSHAEGNTTTAAGYTSHAEGFGTTANGNYSHSEGQSTIANGNTSHAEGFNTTTNKDGSHSEGAYTYVNGDYAHAEGFASSANGFASHVEGGGFDSYRPFTWHGNIASGKSSHAEGFGTSAIGDYSHAEGYMAIAQGIESHSEGWGSNANGEYSHAEGSMTSAVNYGAHAEGNYTSADGECAHAEGYRTRASGVNSHAEGYNTVANSNMAHAEGNSSRATGDNSHAEGMNTFAGDLCDHVEGMGGIADFGGLNHIEGFQYHSYASMGPFSDYYNSNKVKFPNAYNMVLRDGYGNTTMKGTLFELVKIFKEKFIVSCEYGDYSAPGVFHFTQNSFFKPELYNILDVSLDPNDNNLMVITIDGTIGSTGNGSIMLYGPTSIVAVAGTGGPLASGQTLNTFTISGSLGFPGNGSENIRVDNSFIGIELKYTESGESESTEISKFIKILDIDYEASTRTFTFTTEDVVIPEITSGTYGLSLYVINPTYYGCNHIEGQDNAIINAPNSHAEGFSNLIIQSCCHAEGSYNLVSKANAHAEGTHTSAQGNASHAEGSYTVAQSNYSHAEGYKSSVIFAVGEDNYGSHAEGLETSAYLTGSHSEGYRTVANADRAHAEGCSSKATGSNSHAEGYYTIANGGDSHSEGNCTSAYSYQTHAEGLRTYAGATAAHSEGWDTSAMAPGTHAEGKSTYVYGTNAHAEGQYTKATGNYSHVEGAETSAFGSGGHAEGYKTYSNSEYSHAEGNGSRAENSSSHAEGQNTVASAIASHAEGYNTRAASSYAHAEGQNTKASGTAAHAEGNGTIAAGGFSHAEGLNTKATGDCSHATGIGTEALAYAFACGKYNEVNSNDLFTIGNGADASNRNTCFKVDKDGKVWFIYNGVMTDLATTVADKEDKVFVAEVNVTSYADIDAAYNAGKTIVFKYQPAPQGNPEAVYYIKNMQYIPYVGYMCGTINATNCGYFIVCDTNNGQTRWTVSSFASMPEPGGNPTNGQLLSYNSRGNVWIDSPVPSSTAADSGKVLSVDSNGTASWGNAVGFVKNVGQLTDSSQIVAYNLNNGFATLSTSQSALTIVDVVGTDEIVNFAIEITPSVNCTLTIKKKVGSGGFVDLKHSVAAGNELVAGKTYQVTAVGNCWTLAEFE